MQTTSPQRILILGGGFAGTTTALHLEKMLARRPDVEVTLVNRENYSLFTPMLAEVAGGGIEPSHIVNPLRAFFKRTDFREGIVRAIDLERREVRTEHPQSHAPSTLSFDRLVIALGSSTNYRDLPGVADNAFGLKTMADAVAIRDHTLSVLEQAALVERPDDRACMLTFTIAGGGYSGVELCGALEGFIRRALRFYPAIDRREIRMILAHPSDRLLPEVGPELAEYTRKHLAGRGVDVRLSTKVKAATGHSVTLASGEEIITHTLVWTAGTSPTPALRDIPRGLNERGAVMVDRYLEAADWPGVFALGDCAAIPDERTGTLYAPTAQNAIRQAEVAARSVAASLGVGTTKAFEYDPIGALAVLGTRNAVAELKGLRFSGFPAFWMWRTVYWAKLPSIERRLRVAIDWTLDLFFPPSTVQLGSGRMPMEEREHQSPEHESPEHQSPEHEGPEHQSPEHQSPEHQSAEQQRLEHDAIPTHEAAPALVSARRAER